MPARDSTAAPLRLAQRAWRELNKDSARAIALADQALARAGTDAATEGWARLVRGHHLLYFATPPEARTELKLAQACFERAGDRAGWILCGALEARALWREGQFRAAIAQVLPLRDEGLQVLRHEQRGVLVNTIAGCYSAQGDSERAFAYRPTRSRQRVVSAMVRDFVSRVLDGSAEPLLLHLARTERLTPKQRQELRRLIDESDADAAESRK